MGIEKRVLSVQLTEASVISYSPAASRVYVYLSICLSVVMDSDRLVIKLSVVIENCTLCSLYIEFK